MKKLFSTLVALATILVSGPVNASTITVLPGDTLSGLAAKYGTTVQALAQTNGIENPDLIYAGQTLETGTLGASIPTVVALYTDSLASRLTNTGTSFTLVRGTDKQSRNLGGFYGFVMDEGATSEEFFTANCVATACTIVARGIDVQDGKTEVVALKQEHRRGAIVKITNFPQLAVLSRILNGLESASSTFMFGNSLTTQNKKLVADDGTASKPFLQYNEATHSWQYSDDGITTVSINSGAAGGITASTTKGTFLTDGKLGVNASTTGSLAFDANGKLYVNPVYTKNETHSGNISLTGSTTSTGNFRVTTTPSNVNDVPNKNYVDMGVLRGYATGTANGAITAGRALWVTASSTLRMTNSSAASSTFQFVGIAAESKSGGQTVKYVRPGGTVCGLSGLIPGMDYFLNGTAGQMSLTDPANYKAKIGKALSASCLTVVRPNFIAVLTPSISVCQSVADYSAVVGFRPIRIEIENPTTPGRGWWNSAGQMNMGARASNLIVLTNGSAMENVCDTATYIPWAIAATDVGFTLTHTGAGAGIWPANTPRITVYSE